VNKLNYNSDLIRQYREQHQCSLFEAKSVVQNQIIDDHLMYLKDMLKSFPQDPNVHHEVLSSILDVLEIYQKQKKIC
jgi:hypothetical protein